MMKSKVLIGVLSLLPVLIIMLSLPISVSARAYGDFEFEVHGNEAVITGYTGERVKLTIPSQIYVYDVTGIGDEAFKGCDFLESVDIPEGIKSIGDYAFDDCLSLSDISIPSSVTEIGEYAFSQCESLSSVSIPSGIRSIGEGAFFDCPSFSKIDFNGSKEAWESINFGAFNDNIKGAEVEFEQEVSPFTKIIGIVGIGLIVAGVIVMWIIIIKAIRKR